MKKKNQTNATNIIAKKADTVKVNPQFDELKKAFATAFISGTEAEKGATLLELAKFVANSTVNKCLDPQRKTAPDKDKASNSGQSSVLRQLKREIQADSANLANLAANMDKATAGEYNKDGDYIITIVDKAAKAAADKLAAERLGEGMDLIQTAAAEIWAQALLYCDGAPDWTDQPRKITRLDRRVYIRQEDSAAYKKSETTAITEVYRTTRRAVREAASVKTDPANQYTYLEETTEEGDTIYRRMAKWADIGGYAHTGRYSSMAGAPDGYTTSGGGLYSGDADIVERITAIVARLELSDRQAAIIKLRLQGYGAKAIATYFGVKPQSVAVQLQRVRAKAEQIGFTPSMWMEMLDGLDK